MQRQLAKRLEVLERQVLPADTCQRCTEQCPKAKSCPDWYFRAVLQKLEDGRRAGRQLGHLRDALEGLVGIKA
jgi:hypothetical protein